MLGLPDTKAPAIEDAATWQHQMLSLSIDNQAFAIVHFVDGDMDGLLVLLALEGHKDL